MFRALMAHDPMAELARRVVQDAPFSGGPLDHFERVGRDTFITLLENGLLPWHRVLDVGCGALRNGFWLVRFLDHGCYFGIEPWKKMLDTGIRQVLGEALLRDKEPSFSNDTRCNFESFGVRFDRVFARSVITHGGPGMVRELLRQFAAHGTEDGVMLLSFWPPSYEPEGDVVYEPHQAAAGDDLPLDDWRFIPVMTYRVDTLERWAHEFGLVATEQRERPTINQQIWLRVTRAP